MQGKRTRALDSRGRPVPGLYVRDGRFIAGFQCPQTRRWRMENLTATTLTAARREREHLLSALRDGRAAAPAAVTFADAFRDFQGSRNLNSRTLKHERHLLDRQLAPIKHRRVQEVTPQELSRRLRDLRSTYAPWTCVAVYRVLAGTFALAARRGTISRSPVDGLARSERPMQRNAKRIARLEPATVAELVAAGSTKRWRAALALAGYAGLRLGELRGLRWEDVNFEADLLCVRRSLSPEGTPKPPKTAAANREVPLLPALRRLLLEWKLEAPHSRSEDYVIATADGKPVAERNARRAFDAAKARAGLDGTDERLSWHSLRHSFGSMLATNLEVPATTLARLTGHTDAGFTLRVYARDVRETATVVEDVLDRARAAGVAS